VQTLFVTILFCHVLFIRTTVSLRPLSSVCVVVLLWFGGTEDRALHL